MPDVKYYAPEHHLILGKCVFCEHKDKYGKLLHICYKLFDTKELFAIYLVENNTLYILDTEHPVVEEAALEIYKKYNCIIDICVKHIILDKIKRSTCLYKCKN